MPVDPQAAIVNAKAAKELGYTHLRYLQDGGFSRVSLVKKNGDNTEVVMKRLTAKGQDVCEAECLIHGAMSQSGNRNIINYITDVDYEGDKIIFVEYANESDLKEHIPFGLSMKTINMYFKDLLTGLKHIHMLGHCHRDIKSENLFISDGVLKIGDFGLAVRFRFGGTESKVRSGYGTKITFAPENFEKERVDGPALDVWSAGIVLFNMLTNKLPWKRAQPTDPDFSEYLANPGWSGPEFKNIEESSCDGPRIMKLIRKILQVDVSKRISVDEILQDEWVTNFKRTYEQKILEEAAELPSKRTRNVRNSHQ
ncbi:hypothetical protein CRE_14321 [Caenorhabditis remanei]|uniref:Protein kinase domain-containing protein n=1 Tax=Caenorhabditis remanei TaxID=31234 RepID=E3NEZ4_CAERE|nr:hypothetical protein CRE_14321 [Caenorhabditis remanei]